MSRIESSKITEFVTLGPPADSIAVPKMTMFLILVPGDDGSVEVAARQAHVYTQKIRRG